MIIAATGHRPLKVGGYGRQAYLRLFDVAFAYLREEQNKHAGLKHHGLVAVSGMALGWDHAFAAAAWNLGIPFLAIVPFEGQEQRWSNIERGQRSCPPSTAARLATAIGVEPEPFVLDLVNELLGGTGLRCEALVKEGS